MTEPTQWFVRKNEKTHGPFTSQQLKELANGSKIDPSTRLRRGTDGQWVSAQKVKGLFTPNTATANPKPNPRPPALATVKCPPLPTSHSTTPDSPPQPPALPARHIECPYCGEDIAANAIKCRHCNEFLDGRQQPRAAHPPTPIASSASNTTIVVNQRPQNSVAVALILTFFFGPFGMFYSTPIGGLVMLGAWFIIGVLSVFVIGLFLIPIAWIVQMVWAALACDR